MEAQLNSQVLRYIVYDVRGLQDPDLVYNTATKIADKIMDGIDGLNFTNTIEIAALFITNSGAQLILLVRSSDEQLIAPEFRSTLKTVTYEPEIGFLQKYVIPILES